MDKIEDAKLKDFLKEGAARTHRASLNEVIPGLEPEALDLLSKLLEYDPNKRLSAEEALNHPFFQGIKDLHTEEPETEHEPISYFDFEFE